MPAVLAAALVAATAAACSSSPADTVTRTVNLRSVCHLLPASAVSAAIRSPVTAAPSTFDDPATGLPTAACTYAYRSSGNAVDVDLTPNATAQDFHDDADAAGLDPVNVDGIGDTATTDATVGLTVLSRTNLIRVQGAPRQADDDFGEEIQIARDLISALAR
jgi:hypothetical protein